MTGMKCVASFPLIDHETEDVILTWVDPQENQLENMV